ncbi:hypothetical protein QZH41_009135 [Actinostola sp. cb2023]|nr:hypothetical protein QZH41_009135 [Actinostola sp. cb2023]
MSIYRGIQCDLLTGEERVWAISPDEPSSHVACTVEMSNTKYRYECAVIDEIQMMSDVKRGWAWTRALLGLTCEEIHVCGEDTAIEMIQTIADSCGDELEVLRYKRLGPLTVSPNHLGANLSNVKSGDCVVAFSQRELFTIRQKIEKTTGYKCAIVYGGLPPATRMEQAARFNDPKDEHEILVASDAIGMGLNLNIKRIVFKTLDKYDGYSIVQLTPSHTKQIAGRAGRFGSNHPEGEVTTLYGRDFKTLKYLLNRQSKIVQDVFLKVVQLDGYNYFMCDLESVQYIADLISAIPLSIWQQYTVSQAPISQNKPLSASVIVEFARYISTHKEITSQTLKDMMSWPPKMPKTLKGLQETETLHEICDAYLWLSYRFPETFVHQEEVRTMQRLVENVIGAAVSSNLKQRRIPRDTRQLIDETKPSNSKQD